MSSSEQLWSEKMKEVTEREGKRGDSAEYVHPLLAPQEPFLHLPGLLPSQGPPSAFLLQPSASSTAHYSQERSTLRNFCDVSVCERAGSSLGVVDNSKQGDNEKGNE